MQKNSTEPNKKIIATWLNRDKRVLYASFGLKYPQHPKHQPPYKKIGQFDESKDLQELEAALYVLQRSVGINQLLGDPEMERLITFLQDEFEDMNILELDCAINLANGGHLFVEKDGQHYQNFTALWLKTILTPFRVYRLKLITKHNNEVAEMELKELAVPAEPISAEQLLEIDKKYIIGCYENFTNGIPLAFHYRIYDVLSRNNLIIVTRDEQQNFEAKARDNIRRRASKDERAKTLLSAIELMTDIGTDGLIREAKKLAVEAFFTKWMTAEVKESYITNIFNNNKLLK